MNTGPEARVLLVDDNVLLLGVLKEVLEAHEFLVHAAISPSAALALASYEEFEVIVTDVQMPGMSGPDLVAELRKRGCHAPVLYITGYMDDVTLHERARPLLAKPFTNGELMAAIAAAAAQS